MSFDYSKLAQISLTQIANYGRDVTLRRVVEPVYDYDTGTNTGGSDTAETIKAVVTDFELKQVDGSIVEVGDKMFTIAAKDLVKPETNDYLDDWKILNVEEVKTGDTALLYKCQARR